MREMRQGGNNTTFACAGLHLRTQLNFQLLAFWYLQTKTRLRALTVSRVHKDTPLSLIASLSAQQ
jgi:uncharacterized protein YueI